MIGDNAGGTVAGSFNLSAQMPNGKSMTFSGYVLQGETLAEINAKIDLAMQAVERQRLAAEIPELEKKLEQTESAKSQVETIIKDLGTKERLTSMEKQQLNTMRVNLAQIDADIRRGEIAIANARRQTAAHTAAA